jgi:hypothetical protein
LALEAPVRLPLIHEVVEPHGWKKFTEFPRPSIPFTTVPRRSPIGVAAYGS